MSRLIIISNRLPFSIEAKDEQVELRQSSGGLVSALKSYFDKNSGADKFSDKIWVGSAGFSQEEWELAQANISGVDFAVQPIFLEDELYNNINW